MGRWMVRWLGVALCALACTALAQTTPVAGRDYQELSPPRPVSTGSRVEVLEFFYYGCPVCYEAQPHVSRWLVRAGPDVALLRVPAVFTDSSESFARTFYALGAMGQVARLHWPVYDNHHFDGRALNEEKNVVAWVGSNGVDAARFSELWHSDAVQAQIDAAKKALATYDIKGVPSFVVDGKYVTSARMAGGVKEAIQVLDYLVQRAATERKK
jgi:thiol:disulfide interchange protein DsbA